MLQNELKELLLSLGASDVGFFGYEGPSGMKYGVTVAVALSPAIVAEISDAPTHTYFNHYRSVNALIDSLLLRCGLFLQKNGYKYITVAASQSININGWSYSGRFSHKHGAVLSGMGCVGKNSLFIHNKFGSLVRLGTVFTDCPFELCEAEITDLCGSCTKCVDACPAKAISGESWRPGIEREMVFNPSLCSDYMKKQFQHIGRGSVCGICMRVCPHNKLD